MVLFAHSYHFFPPSPQMKFSPYLRVAFREYSSLDSMLKEMMKSAEKEERAWNDQKI